MPGIVRTKQQQILEQAIGSWRDLPSWQAMLSELGDHDEGLLEQVDAPLLSSTGGVFNKIFTRTVWPQLNLKAQFYNAIPRVQARKGAPYGWRAKTAFASTGRGGQAEGTMPDSVLPAYFEVGPTIKEHTTVMQVSGLQQDLADGPDDAYGSLADVASELATEHVKEFERALTLDIDTLSSNSIESADRMTASSANQAAIGWTAGDEDFNGVDRSAQTWFDAEQLARATAVALTLKDIDGQIRKVFKNGGETTFILTGWDTWEAISDLYESRGRFEIGLQKLPTGGKQGDADIPEGLAAATFLSYHQGLPVIPSDQAKADTNEVSRLYGLDIGNPEGFVKPRVGIDVLAPTKVFLEGENSSQGPKSVGYMGDFATARTRHELVTRFAKAQWQLRDATAP